MLTRLSLALETGELSLPGEGLIGIFGAPARFDIGPIDPARLHVVQGFRPDYDSWVTRGIAVDAAPAGPYAAAIVTLPRSKPAAHARIAQAAATVRPGGLVIVDGQKTEGIESILKGLRARVPIGGSLSKHHGKLLWFAATEIPDWAAEGAEIQLPDGFVTVPGVFSADRIDRGSALLAAALPATLPRRVADFGAGWGYLARAILSRDGVETLDLFEADHAALACAKRNVIDPRARFHWSDVTRADAGPFDAIVTNPPFHTDRRADPTLGQAFLAAAARALAPQGRIWVVANRHLPYERGLAEMFAHVDEIGGAEGYKLLMAARPRRDRRHPVTH